MKDFLKKFLVPIGIWGFLLNIWRFLRKICHSLRFIVISFSQRYIHPAKFAPLFGKSRFIWLDSYDSRNEELQGIAMSQSGQEIFILDNLLRIERGGGVFVDVGANDPVSINNTYALEQLGWIGISFEPIRSLQEQYEKERTTKCFPYLIGDDEDFADFVEIFDCKYQSYYFSHIAKYGRRKTAPQDIVKTYKIQVRKLENVLKENNIDNIDILFVDTEGYELNVLKSIDFDKVGIKCICVESQYGQEHGIRTFLTNNGYNLMAHVGCDDIFVYGNRIKW